jgi:glycosyltransferase involved in cell wall biosynthesis
MTNLLMISGDRSLASGKHGAYFNTLQELRNHFDRIDVICPRVSVTRYDMSLFGNVFVHPSPWPLMFQPLWIWLKGRQLSNALTPNPYSLITCHDYPPFYNGIGARMLHRSVGVPYVVEVMHVPGVPRASGLRERLCRWLMRMLVAWDVRPARAVRVINQHQTPDFLVASGVPREKIFVAPAFYIDLDVFKPQDTPKKYDIAFVGRMTTNKGLNIFLDVMQYTGLVGVCVGDGLLLDWARNQAKKRGLKVHFPGYAPDAVAVAKFINESRMLLMPSLNEGGPRVVLEAMACGVPVVATSVGIVPDVLPPECIEEWNAKDMADKVRNILGDTVLYRRLQSQGIEIALQFERSAAIGVYAHALKRIAGTDL